MTLQDAITKKFEAKAAEAEAAEQAKRERARADLALFGTPAWDLLTEGRRRAAAREQLAEHDEALDTAEKARATEAAQNAENA